jgi:hypothetical protein
MLDAKSRDLQFRYEDVPDLLETFADSIGQWYFDGHTLRIEFLVSRLDGAANGGTAHSGRRRPVCRIALTAPAAVELVQRAGQLAQSFSGINRRI